MENYRELQAQRLCTSVPVVHSVFWLPAHVARLLVPALDSEQSTSTTGSLNGLRSFAREGDMGTILIILLILLLLGAVPRWGYSRNWGYFPSGTLGLILLIVIILVLIGRI